MNLPEIVYQISRIFPYFTVRDRGGTAIYSSYFRLPWFSRLNARSRTSLSPSTEEPFLRPWHVSNNAHVYIPKMGMSRATPIFLRHFN